METDLPSQMPCEAGSRRSPYGTAMPPDPVDLRPLLPAIRAGDEAAARCLVESLHPLVQRIVRAHLPRRAAEEDLAQDILVKVFQRLDQFRGDVPVHHWVARIAVNHCRNAIRAQIARPEWRMADLSEEQASRAEAASLSSSESPSPGSESDSRFTVEQLLSILEPRDRALIQWLEIDDLSIEEICRRTGWSSTLVRVRAFRARRRLNTRFHELQKKGLL
jgi:RNA polymerase sigma-70 factor (ECF subfamily)